MLANGNYRAFVKLKKMVASSIYVVPFVFGLSIWIAYVWFTIHFSELYLLRDDDVPLREFWVMKEYAGETLRVTYFILDFSIVFFICFIFSELLCLNLWTLFLRTMNNLKVASRRVRTCCAPNPSAPRNPAAMAGVVCGAQ